MRYWKFAKKIRPLLIAALFPFGTGVCAQEMPCAGDFTYTESRSSTCDYQSQSWINTYGKQGSYVPGELLNNDVVKTIVVAIHIWRKDDGSGNWENNQTTIDDLTYAAEQLNGNMFTYNDEPSDPIPGTASMPDTKIRVSLMGIFFHQNTAIWGLTCFDGATITAAAIAENPEVVKALNLHVINPTCCDNWSASGAATGGTQGTSASTSQVVSETWGTTVNTWVWPQHWAHEMGHNLSLKHTYNSENCQFSQGDFLFDVFGSVTPPGCAPSGSCDVCYHQAGWSCDVNQTTNTCTNNMMGGTQHAGYYSPLQIGRQHRALMTNSVKKYTSGYSATPYVIAEDEEWDFEIKFYQDVLVPAGVTLTVKCSVEFVPQARIVVEAGGRLILDGGHLRSADFDIGTWKGVEVHGNSTQHQNGGPLATYQGKLEIKNGGTIENAEVGAMACARMAGNMLDLLKTGGIIIADQANFKNCSQAILMMPWPNPSGGLSLNTVNKSRFKRTNFSIDSDFPTGPAFQSHVALWRVYGINFEGCSFKNSKLDNEVTGSDELGEGIYSLDAKYTVKSYCTGPWLEPGHVCYAGEIRSLFEGLDHAIEAGDAITTRNFSVSETDFINNICGVYANGVLNPVVKNNHFVMGKRGVELTGNEDESFQGYHRAVYTTESYATRIDDNTIDIDPNAQTLAEGVVVGFCRDHNDVVFRNHANGLESGFVGEGVNADPDNQTGVGLWWLCNTNNGNVKDLYCRVPEGITQPGDVAESTVRLIQGANNRPSDNTFDRLAETPAEGDIKSENDQNVINYRYWQNVGAPQFDPIGLTDGYVAKQPSTQTQVNNCSRRVLITHVVGDHVDGTVVDGMTVLNDSKLAYGNTRYLYDQLIDGGSTDEVVDEITQSWPEDAWELRTYLLSRSPYLSAEVLKQAVTQNVMPQAMLTEVMVANPEATQRDGFLRWLQDLSAHPLPEYLADLVTASWNVRTYRFTLESTMAGHHTNMTMSADLVLEEYQRDTIAEPVDSLRSVWQRVRTKSARYAEALTRMQQGNFAAALSVVQTIPAEHDLKSPEELERQRMLAFIMFMKTVYDSGRNETALTGSEIAQLESIIGGKYDRPAAWAQNILCYGYGHCRPPLTGGRGGGARRFVHANEPAFATTATAKLWAQPNPAAQYTTLFYELLNAPADAWIVLRDILGQEQQRFQLTTSSGQVLWDTRKNQPGTYTAELMNAGVRVSANRVVVKP